MKALILSIALCIGLCSFSGCDLLSALGGGATTEALHQQADSVKAERDKAAAEKAEAEAQLAQATDETEIARLKTQIAALDKTVIDLNNAIKLIELGENISGTDWTDPEVATPVATTLVAGLLALFFKRKNKVTDLKYTAHKRVLESVMRSAEGEKAAKIYKAVGDERTKLGVS